jgi:alpha-galactosidase
LLPNDLTFYFSYTATVAGHGSLVLKLSGTTASPTLSYTYYNAVGSSATLSGGANSRVVSSSVSVAGNIGMGGTVTFNGVDGGSSGGTKTLSVDYINAEVTFTNTACSNCRNAYFSVNGGAQVLVQFPISAQVCIYILISFSILANPELTIIFCSFS